MTINLCLFQVFEWVHFLVFFFLPHEPTNLSEKFFWRFRKGTSFFLCSWMSVVLVMLLIERVSIVHKQFFFSFTAVFRSSGIKVKSLCFGFVYFNHSSFRFFSLKFIYLIHSNLERPLLNRIELALLVWSYSGSNLFIMVVQRSSAFAIPIRAEWGMFADLHWTYCFSQRIL